MQSLSIILIVKLEGKRDKTKKNLVMLRSLRGKTENRAQNAESHSTINTEVKEIPKGI